MVINEVYRVSIPTEVKMRAGQIKMVMAQKKEAEKKTN